MYSSQNDIFIVVIIEPGLQRKHTFMIMKDMQVLTSVTCGRKYKVLECRNVKSCNVTGFLRQSLSHE